MEPRGLIFDFDGTLVDTMPLHWEAWQVVMNRYELHFPEDRFYSLGGVPSRDIVKMLAEEQGKTVDHLKAAHEKGEAFLERFHLAKPIDPILNIAREHHGKLPLGIATGGSRSIVSRVMENLGITHLFDALVTNEDIVNQKPAPDIYLEAARRIGVAPEHCRAYEDTDLGMTAIRAAGMEAVDVRVVLA